MSYNRVYSALFSAFITLILASLIVGVRLNDSGDFPILEGAGITRWTGIGIATALVFLSQLFAPEIDKLLGRIPHPKLSGFMPERATQRRLKPWLLAALLVIMLV